MANERNVVSFDGSNKAEAGSALHVAFGSATSPRLEAIKAEVFADTDDDTIDWYRSVPYPEYPDVEVDAATLTPEEWQARRGPTVGASFGGVIMGCSGFGSTLSAQCDKLGLKPIFDDEMADVPEGQMDRQFIFDYGHVMEGPVADYYQRQHPSCKVMVDTNIYQYPGKPWLTINLDRMIQLPDGTWQYGEIKTFSMHKVSVWADGGLPLDYEVQVRIAMAILNIWEAVVMAQRRNGEKIEIRHVTRDLEKEREIIEALDNFWNLHVVAQKPLAPEEVLGPFKSIKDSLMRYYGPAQPAKVAAIDAKYAEDAARCIEAKGRYDAARQAADSLKAEYEEAQKNLIVAIGDAARGEIKAADGTIYCIDYKNRATKPKVDVKKLVEDYPEVVNADYYTPERITSRTFSIKEVKVK